MKIIYIAETSLENKSAYSLHVIKMCHAFVERNLNLTLVIPNKKKNINYHELKKKFLLRSRKPFKIKSLLNSKIHNFYSRINFGIKASKFSKNEKPDLIITRSFLTSFFLSILKINHFLEIHHELRSLTKFLFVNLNFINSKYIKRIIFISSALRNKFNLDNKKNLVLHDAVDLKNFDSKKKNKKIKKIEVATYVGSFYKGRGIEKVYHLAKKFNKITFKLYGDNKNYFKKLKNIKYFGHVDYNKVPNILLNSDVLLMPYSNNVSVRSNNINTANYCSPLKMFDYLASGRIILSSKLDGICEVLKHNHNAIIVNKYTNIDWSKTFKDLINNKYNLNKIQYGSIKTSESYTWRLRASKIIEANNN